MQSGSNNDEKPTKVGGVPVYVLKKRDKRHLLRLVKGPGAPQEIPLDIDEIVIGRSIDAHLTLESDSISRRHARVFYEGETVVCEDLGSSNGLYVNGEKIARADLRDGDSLQIGDAVFLFQSGA